MLREEHASGCYHAQTEEPLHEVQASAAACQPHQPEDKWLGTASMNGCRRAARERGVSEGKR